MPSDERIREQMALVHTLQQATQDPSLTDLQRAKAANLLEEEDLELAALFAEHEERRCPTTRS